MPEGSILVTGGAGMIGSNLVRRLLQQGCEVTVVDNLWRGSLDNLHFPDVPFDLKTRFFQRDLREPGVLESLPGPFDYVVHLADVVAGVDYVFSHQGEIFRNNILINTHVVASVRNLRPRGYLYVGTACSFPQALQSGPEARPLREEDQYPADPESAYGWGKLMGEYEALLMEKEAGIPACVLVFHNVYGAPCDLGPRAQVIPSLLRKAARYPAEPFVVWGSGAQGRAFVYIDDVVDALVAGLDRGWGHGPIQIGPDSCTMVRELAEVVVALSRKGMPIEFDLTKPEGDRGRCANYDKARRILGWEPRTTLADGMAKTYRWVCEHVD